MANKTRVNLYLPSMRPVKEKLPLSQMIIFWFVGLALMAAVSYFQYTTFTEVSAILKQSTIELDVSKDLLSKLEERHADFKPSPQLMTKLERLSQELNGKRFLSQHLEGKVVPQAKRYSQVMIDLGRFHDNNLWVTKMRFEDDGVFLKGFALDALAVPQWLNRLQQSEFFSGKSFALMNLKDSGNDVIAFEINTVAKSEMSEDEKLAAIKSLTQGGK